MNKLYKKGARFEYKVKNFFEEIGAEVVRGAGSHGIDLVIMFPNPINQNWLVSCKVGKYITKEERDKLMSLKNYKNDGVFVAYPLRGMICLQPING